jgi:beta-glucosidase
MKTISTLPIIVFMKACAVAGASVFIMASGAGCATPYSPPPQAAKSQSASSTESSMAMRDKRVLPATPIQKSKPVTTQLTEAPAPKPSAPIAQVVEQPAAASAAPSAEPVAVVAEQSVQQSEPVAENAQAPAAVVVEQSAQQPEAAPVIAPEPIQSPATTTPVSRESGAFARQNLVLERANTSHAQVVLIGDSITEGWEGARDQLQSLVGLRSAANLGVGGDRTQHVLWRLQQAPLMSVNPKVIVLMIGTNNIYDDSADDIVAGIRAITALMNQQCPNAEILVLDIPPRGDPMDSARAKIAQINAELAQGEWPGHARFVRVGNQFLGADGALDRANLPDLLHFSQKGYAMWAAAIKPELDASLAANHSQPAPTTPQP